MTVGTLADAPAAPLQTPLAPRVTLPTWQVALVLVGWPAAYLINSFMPWSRELFGRLNPGWFYPFWASVTLLHWASVAFVAYSVRRGGRSLRDIGLVTSPRRMLAMLACLVALGAALVLLRANDARPPAPITVAAVMLPRTTGQRLFWIAMSLTAGICEELVYRGFAIRALRGRGMRAWLALMTAAVSFVFVHGLAGVFAFPIYFTFGLLFGALFLWRRTLAPGVCLHAAFDMFAILA
jgi:membrane protease YdiL (CAAX protease family)